MAIPLWTRLLSRVAAQEFLRSTSLTDAFGAVLKRIDIDRLGISALEAENITRLGVNMAIAATEAQGFGDLAPPLNQLPEVPVELRFSGQYHWDFVIGYSYQENGVDKIGYVPVMYTTDTPMTFNEAFGKAIEMLDDSMETRQKYNVAQDYTIMLDKVHLIRLFHGV